jgi:hypothetical protein
MMAVILAVTYSATDTGCRATFDECSCCPSSSWEDDGNRSAGAAGYMKAIRMHKIEAPGGAPESTSAGQSTTSS